MIDSTVKKVSVIALAVAACAFAAAASAQTVQTHHVRNEVSSAAVSEVGRLPKTQELLLDIVLPVRDRAGLTSFVAAVTDPRSPSFRQYLTPAQFTEKFGPKQEDYDAVVAYAKAHGLKVSGGSRDGMEVQVRGKVADIERAFNVDLKTYHDPVGNRTFYAVDREPTTSLGIPLWHVSGLDNYSIPRPALVKRADYAAARGVSPESLTPAATTGSGPSASFLGSDMRAAYYGKGKLTGKGQNLGLLEYYGTDLADLATYYKNVGQKRHVPVTLLSTDGTSTSCLASAGCDDTEQTLDMTQALGMAPGLANLTMYIGSIDTAIISAMTTHSPLPLTIGCSWTWTPVDVSTLDPYFQKMAAQGQSFFSASGDSKTWSKSVNPWPADDAYVIAVGGTDLVTASAAGPWQSETAWLDSGGGINPNKIAIPAWQQLAGVITTANKGSTTLRNGPDVSANSNFTFYTCADQTTCLANNYGGTSFATPMWAGFVALANQKAAAAGKNPVGFFNPLVYATALTSSYATDFHDITSGSAGSNSAVVGYDLVTGWGSPTAALINTLVP